MSTEKGIAKKIVSTGYFAKQIPQEFISTNLAEHIELLNLSKSKLSKGLNKWCKLIDFSFPKTENFRRNFAVSHPLHYILLAKLIEEHWETLEIHFSKSKFSLTTPQITDESIEPKYEMSEKINRRINNLVSKKYILQADITRYYPSIYTHSIPWALHTKVVAKANSKDDSYIGNVIDRLVRNMQDGQTIGIPIGPVTSLIVQEIVGVAIDEEFKSEYGNNLTGFRYTDDMEYYFSSLEEAERAQNILNKTLKKYELDLNISKTKVFKIPQVLEPEWLYYFNKYNFRFNNKNKEQSINLQRIDIKEYFSAAFKYKIQVNDKGILNYAIKTLRKIVIYRENWDMVESLLLQSILVDSTIIPTVFEIIEGYKYRGYSLNYERIVEFINVLIKDNIELKNDFEVSWALSFALKLSIVIKMDASELLLQNDNAIINILVMILYSNNLLEGDLDFSYYESLLTEESLYDSNWLFYYECCINGWLGKDKNNRLVKEDKFFGQLLNKDITFVNPNYSEVLEKVKKSIISICHKHFETNMSSFTPKEVILKVIDDYSFSIEDESVEELSNQFEVEITKIKEEGTQQADEEVEETQQADEEVEETQQADEEVEETQQADEEVEGTQQAKEEGEETQRRTGILDSNKSWIFNFFNTNINKTSKIRAFEIEIDYWNR